MPIRLLNRGEIKYEARELIRTARVSPIKFTLLYLAIALVLDLLDTGATVYTGSLFSVAFFSISFLSILVSLISDVLSAGYHCYCLGVHRGEEMPYESLFDGFTFAGKVIALTVVEGIFIALWSMLFVIPGIIAVYRYSFAMWNLCADPSIGVMEALDRSKQQTRGYKWQFFVLQFSFIGWALLVGLVTSAYEWIVTAWFPGGGLAAMLLGTCIYALLSGVVEVYLKPYYTLSACGFYLRATAPHDMGGAQGGDGYEPEF